MYKYGKFKVNAIPEDFGISCDAVNAFLDDLDFRGMNMHSLMIIVDGNVIAEGYYPPFDAARLRRMYLPPSPLYRQQWAVSSTREEYLLTIKSRNFPPRIQSCPSPSHGNDCIQPFDYLIAFHRCDILQGQLQYRKSG